MFVVVNIDKVNKLFMEFRQSGIKGGIKKINNHIRFRVEHARRRPDPIFARRVELYEALNVQLNSTVAYGAFKGMVMASKAKWGGPDRAPMLLGIYELEVMKALEKSQARSGVFIDLGAADGYYAVGGWLAGRGVLGYCFEMSVVGQEIIQQNAVTNKVSDRLTVYGTANNGFYSVIPAQDLRGAVMLVDIEGGEFDLIDFEALQALESVIIIIEIHAWVIDGELKLQRLIENAHKTHTVSRIKAGPRDPGQFGELQSLCDTDRWLLCSEDRPILMEWLQLVPKGGEVLG